MNTSNQEAKDSVLKQLRDDASFLSEQQQPAQTTAYDLTDLPDRPDKEVAQRAALKLLS